MNQTTSIYALLDPRSNEIRYVGKSNNANGRLGAHIKQSLKSTKSKKQAWLKGLLDSGVKPELIILDEVPIKEWEFWEMHYISLCKSWGFKLTNMTNGGECGSGIAWNKGLTKEMDERVKLYGIRGRWKRGKMSEELRISSYNNYEHLKGEKHPLFGKHFSFESKEKMCLTKKARVFKVTKDYQTILEVFMNGKDALSKCCLNGRYKDIPTLLNNGNKVIDDSYILVREVDYEKLKANPPKPFVCGWGSNKKGVEVKNSEGKVIHSFISVGETAKFFDKSEWKIKEILHRKENGFWKEENLYLKFKNNENGK